MHKPNHFHFPRRASARLAGLLAAACLVAGCSHTTQLARQADSLAIPAEWHAAGSQAQRQTPEDLSRWWQRFGDEQLSELIAQALAANPSLQSSQAALRQARAQRDVQAAGLLPSVGSSAGAGRSRQGNNGANNRYNLGLDASWEPDWWGRQENAVQAGEANVRAAEAGLEGAQVALVAEVALNYVELRTLQDRLRIAKENLLLQQETQQITGWRVQAGLATSLDSEQARQSTAQTAAQIPSLSASIAQANHALAILTGQPPATLLDGLQASRAVPQAPDSLAHPAGGHAAPAPGCARRPGPGGSRPGQSVLPGEGQLSQPAAVGFARA